MGRDIEIWIEAERKRSGERAHNRKRERYGKRQRERE